MSTLASCTTSLTPFGVDISGGKEPIAIRAEGVNADQLAHFHVRIHGGSSERDFLKS